MSDHESKPNLDLKQPRYLLSLHRVFSHIEKHLTEDLKLEKLAVVAAFSHFHFHRLFKLLTNENVNTYVRRKRIERAASLLMRSEHSTISDVVFQCGFKSQATFSRAFKKFYGISPSEFRKLSPSRYAQLKSKKSQRPEVFEAYVCQIEQLKHWLDMNGNIEVKRIASITFAGLNHMGKAGLSETFDRLITWAGKKGLMHTSPQLGMVYYDSYKVTSPDKVRMAVCIEVDRNLNLDGGLARIEVPKGRHIIGRFEIGMEEFEKSWSSLFIWMNENGYKKRDEPPFELYRNNFNEHPEKKFIVDMYIPVE